MTSTEPCCGHEPRPAGPRQRLVRSARLAGRSGALALPAVLLALLPKCPLCWSAYGAVLSALGMSGLHRSPTWSPLLLVALVVALLALVPPTRLVGDRRPFALACSAVLAASLGVGIGCGWLVTAGGGAFVGAVAWVGYLGVVRADRAVGS